MSTYRKRRYSSGSYRRKSGAGTVITWLLVAFLVISLVPVLFSLGDLRSELPTEPSGTVTDHPVDPTDPPEPVYESGYLLYQIDDDTGIKQYLNIRDSSKGGSLKTDPADACLYEWNPILCTFYVADPDVLRFLSGYLDSDVWKFSTHAIATDYDFAQFYSVEGDVFVTGEQCPLVEGEPYYLVIQRPDRYFFYDGTASSGSFGCTTDELSAKEVYVEYVTREVIS